VKFGTETGDKSAYKFCLKCLQVCTYEHGNGAKH